MASGAQRRHFAMVIKEATGLASMGVLAGLVAALGFARVFKSLLLDIRAVDPMTSAAAALLLFTVALLASRLPARRAVQVDPMAALRAERRDQIHEPH